MTDRTTKILMVLIVLGLWANVSVELFHPTAIAAQDNTLLTSIDNHLSSIDDHLSDIKSNVDSLERITRGTCSNGKIC